jgi:hypothetical protein
VNNSIAGGPLPQDLQAWSDAQQLPMFVSGIFLFSFAGIIAGSVAMLAKRRWGFWLHMISNIGGVAVVPFDRAQPVTGFGLTIHSLIMIAAGIIYSLGFFTDALPSRDKKNSFTIEARQ